MSLVDYVYCIGHGHGRGHGHGVVYDIDAGARLAIGRCPIAPCYVTVYRYRLGATMLY